jgi:hypothetical protein
MPIANVSPLVDPSELSHDLVLRSGSTDIGLFFDGIPQHQPISAPDREFTETMKDWTGGRGRQLLRDDPLGYWDAKDAFTLTSGKLFPGLEWYYGTGIRTAERDYAGSVAWKSLYGTQRFISRSFDASATSTRTKIQLKIRQVGRPSSNLTYAVYSNTSGNPNVVLSGAIATRASAQGDWEGKDLPLTLGTAASLASGITYSIVVYGGASDTETDHWEVGVNASGTGSKISTAGSSWSTPSPDFGMYYNIVAVEAGQRLWFWTMDSALYCINARYNNASPTIYINGDRGTADATSTPTTLVDSASGVRAAGGWVVDEWIGWYVKIIDGTGQGQIRLITDSATTSVSVAAWDVTPDATSRYVFYGGLKWTALTGAHGLTVAPTGRPCAGNKVTYFPQGTAINTQKMREDSGSADNHGYAAVTDVKYDLYEKHPAPVTGFRLYGAKCNDAEVKYTALPGWGVAPTFNSIKGQQVGESDHRITSLQSTGETFHIGKANGLWVLEEATPRQLTTGAKDVPDMHNFEAITAIGDVVYYGFGGSFGYLVGNEPKDIINYRSGYEGLPADRSGYASCALTIGSWVLFAMDGGANNYSSVYAWNGIGLHEIFRAWATGVRIRDIFFRPCEETWGQLWMDCGGEPVCVKFPYQKVNPLLDTSLPLRPWFSKVCGTIDIGKENLYKAIGEVRVSSKNLSHNVCWVEVDYQKNEDVDTASWTRLGKVSVSPYQALKLTMGRIRKIRLRVRAYTTASTTPPIVTSIDVSGRIAEPPAYQWIGTFKVFSQDAETRDAQLDDDANYKYKTLKKWHDEQEVITMKAQRLIDHDKQVTISLPLDQPYQVENKWDGRIQLVLREVAVE